MTRDERVEMGREIADRLVGITISEWNRWLEYVKNYGINRGIRFAEALKYTPSLRPGPRRSYKAIISAIRPYKRTLINLSKKEVEEILGYARQWLYARRIF